MYVLWQIDPDFTGLTVASNSEDHSTIDPLLRAVVAHCSEGASRAGSSRLVKSVQARMCERAHYNALGLNKRE